MSTSPSALGAWAHSRRLSLILVRRCELKLGGKKGWTRSQPSPADRSLSRGLVKPSFASSLWQLTNSLTWPYRWKVVWSGGLTTRASGERALRPLRAGPVPGASQLTIAPFLAASQRLAPAVRPASQVVN